MNPLDREGLETACESGARSACHPIHHPARCSLASRFYCPGPGRKQQPGLEDGRDSDPDGKANGEHAAGDHGTWEKNLVTSEAVLPQPTQRIREYYTVIIRQNLSAAWHRGPRRQGKEWLFHVTDPKDAAVSSDSRREELAAYSCPGTAAPRWARAAAGLRAHSHLPSPTVRACHGWRKNGYQSQMTPKAPHRRPFGAPTTHPCFS